MNDSLPSCSYTGEQVVDSSFEKIDHSQNTSFKQQISDNSEPVDCEYVNEEQDTDILNVYPQEAQIDIVNRNIYLTMKTNSTTYGQHPMRRLRLGMMIY